MFIFLHMLELVICVSPCVADKDLGFLALLFYHLDELLPPFLG
ncbi:hypothetical protein OMAG_001718 [Candidatus Omnitrophus magneticus]|uniref:Uncharacterized protein n=1 Tax=Candidatus Omnitrophus magneticus TaxID=1609969 RepID=A0A0F0CSB7_9BACT|nr:hypothetical protein OMAG_001718 [Candidatus Omnitrophus magneticus]